MSFLDFSDAKESSFELIPEGQYLVKVEDAEVKDTKSGTGQYINVKFKVCGGKHDGKVLFHMFNIKNDNAKAVEIGLGQLKMFFKCAGKTEFQLQTVSDLCGMIASALVKHKSDSYGDKAVISYFKQPSTMPATAGGDAPIFNTSEQVPF